MKCGGSTILKGAMASLVHKLYSLGVMDASPIGSVFTPNITITAQNNPKDFVKTSSAKATTPNPIRIAHSACTPH